MATYTFRCTQCKEEFDEEMDRKESRTPPCPECGSKKTRKVIQATPVIYKADGFTLKKDKGQ